VHSEWSHALALRCSVALQRRLMVRCAFFAGCVGCDACVRVACQDGRGCVFSVWRCYVLLLSAACLVRQAAREHSRAAAFGPHPITYTHAQCSAGGQLRLAHTE
jgi:hypothetical protein